MSGNTNLRPDLAAPSQQVVPQKPADIVRRDLDRMKSQFSIMLPQHIPVDRFIRTVVTAINKNPDLATADRRTLYGACMSASNDGLLPDGREGALVVFNTKMKGEDGKDKWVKAVQWMPMVWGLKKKIRQSGEISDLHAHAVYSKDEFHYVLGDEEKITHVPYQGDGDPGQVCNAYAIAKFKDGTISRKVLRKIDIEKMRAGSRSANGPAWSNWYDQMAEKCAIRRLSKDLPMSTEIENALNREDTLSVVNASGKVEEISLLNEGDNEVIDVTATEVQHIEHQPEEPMQEVLQEGVAQTVRGASDKKTKGAAEVRHDPETGEVHDDAGQVDQSGDALFSE